MALGTKIIDLIGIDLFNQAVQVARIGEVPVMQEHPLVAVLRIVQINVVNPPRIERTAPPHNPVNSISLLKQQFSQVTPVLARNTGDQCDF